MVAISCLISNVASAYGKGVKASLFCSELFPRLCIAVIGSPGPEIIPNIPIYPLNS